MKILGISAFYHDAAAALLDDGVVVAAAHEERFTRRKHDPSFPASAVRFVLAEAGLGIGDLHAIAFYDKPFIKFERLLETYHAFAPRGLTSFYAAMPVWIREKLFTRRLLREELAKIADGARLPKIFFPEHHLSHAASAFYPSPFDKAAILTIDGVGEWATTTIAQGEASRITVLRELHFPHSLGLLYSAFTHYAGFKVNSGEYKLMGLSPYGQRHSPRTRDMAAKIRAELVDLRFDGSLVLNMDYFDFAVGLTMCADDRWEKLFGFPRRLPEAELTQAHMDLACAAQELTEDCVLALARTARKITGLPDLVMAGGVALNCVANGRIVREKIFDRVWIQPAAGDAGGALGAALAAHHIGRALPRTVREPDAMAGAYLGPAFSRIDVERLIRRFKAPYRFYERFDVLCRDVATFLAEGRIVGWFQGRMEWGPRALGNRSILGDPGDAEMQKKINLSIKFRESFRPFAPAVLEEDAGDFFDLDGPSPYMLLVAPVREERRLPAPENPETADLFARLNQPRSDIPAVTHVDCSARIQTVSRETNERFWQLLSACKKESGRGMLINTSFNVRGEPIVCTPLDAYRCFMRTGMDLLVLEDFVFVKEEQPRFSDREKWQELYELD